MPSREFVSGTYVSDCRAAIGINVSPVPGNMPASENVKHQSSNNFCQSQFQHIPPLRSKSHCTLNMFPLGRFFTVWVVIWHICLSSTSNAHVTEHQDAMPTCEGSMTCHDEEVDGGFDSALASKVGFKLYTPVCPDPAMPTATTGASVESGTQTIAIPPTRAVHVTHIMILTSDVPEPVTTNASVKATPAPTPRV